MKTHIIIILFLFIESFYSCNLAKNQSVQNKKKQSFNRVFKSMKPIYSMEGTQSSIIKPFDFYISKDSILVDNTTFYKSKIYKDNDIYLGVSNDSLYSLIRYADGVYSKNIFLVFNDNYEGVLIEPFGGHKIYLKEIHDDRYDFRLYQIKETYDLDFNTLDSIEIKQMIVSKKYGIEKLTIKDNYTKEIFIAAADKGVD